MILYFDKTGKLKEVINDEALRQGNYGVNKMYVYIDREDVESIDVAYLLPDGLVVGPGNYEDTEEMEIPFDPKRDLYWFKYHKTYKFIVVDLETDINGNGPLDQTGVVHCNMSMNLTGGQVYALGEVNFNVELNSTLNQNQVATQEYMSLSNYLFLRSLINKLNPGQFPYAEIYVENTTLKLVGPMDVQPVSKKYYYHNINLDDEYYLTAFVLITSREEPYTFESLKEEILRLGNYIGIGGTIYDSEGDDNFSIRMIGVRSNLEIMIWFDPDKGVDSDHAFSSTSTLSDTVREA